ncbi:Protein phosphatase PTC7-like protein fig, partial [Bienertia sinuspersici]
ICGAQHVLKAQENVLLLILLPIFDTRLFIASLYRPYSLQVGYLSAQAIFTPRNNLMNLIDLFRRPDDHRSNVSNFYSAMAGYSRTGCTYHFFRSISAIQFIQR